MYTQERCIVYDVVVELHICYVGDCRPGHAQAVKLHVCSACCMLCALCIHSYHLRLECPFLSKQGVDSLSHLYITWILGMLNLEQETLLSLHVLATE